MDRITISRRVLPYLLVAPVILGSIAPALGEIGGGTKFSVDLCKPHEASQKVRWSDPEHIPLTAMGLGWGTAAEEGTRDFWIETIEPIPLGLSWRPTTSAVVKATIHQPGRSGLMYARYSADGAHWSSWQLMEETKPRNGQPAVQEFRGQLRVPYRESAFYNKLRMRYARRDDVPWGSDEEALANDIIKREPRFFEKSIPFVGYVQILYEAQLPAGARIKSLEVQFDWWVGGIHQPARDPAVQEGRDNLPWRFKAP